MGCYHVTVSSEIDEDESYWSVDFHICHLDELLSKIREAQCGLADPWKIVVQSYGEVTH